MSKNILITAIGGDIACATLRCIKDGYIFDKIIGCDINPYVQGLQYVHKFLLAPKYADIPAYVSFIKDTCIREEITHFLPMSEPEIKIANEHRYFFSEHNIKLMINNKLIIETALSKYKTAHFLKEHGLTVPETFYASEYQGQLPYPLIIKPDKSCGSKNVHLIRIDGELTSVLKKSEDVVIQEYIGSDEEEYTMGIYSDGEIVKSIAFRRRLGFGGMSIFVETVVDPELDKVAYQVAKAFQLQGSVNIQMRKRDKQYYIFEINPRISSTVGFRHKLGFQDVIWWLKLLDGQPDKPDYIPEGGRIGIKTLDEMILN